MRQGRHTQMLFTSMQTGPRGPRCLLLTKSKGRTPPNRQKKMLCVGRVVCVFSLREDTQEGLVGLCEAGCRVLSVSAAPALEREFYA